MALDATSLGMVCVKARIKKDMETILDAIGGGEDGLTLTKDVNFDLEFLDEGKSLAMVGDKVVSSKAEAIELFQNQEIDANAKFKTPMKLAFCNMKAMKDTSASVGESIKKKEAADAVAKKEKEEQEERERDAKEIADLGPISYYPQTEVDWVIPETFGEDSRKDDKRCVSGGTPQLLEAPSVKQDMKRPASRNILNYMVGEPDKNGNWKVYIEEPEVVNCDRSQIRVEFSTNSYSVHVDTGSEPLVLGPVECSQIDVQATSWRLSPGKRLTLSFVKAGINYMLPRRSTKSGPADVVDPAKATENEGKAGQSSSQLVYVLFALIPVIIAIISFYVKHAQGR